jgi:HSP20 family protein
MNQVGSGAAPGDIHHSSLPSSSAFDKEVWTMANTMTRYGQQNGVTRLPDLMDRLFRESFVMPGFIDSQFEGSRPALPVNLFETKDSFVFHAALPGLNPENVDIQVVGRKVSIKGKFEINTPEGGSWVWQGIPTGEFYETYTLPVDVDGNSVEAGYERGILSIVLPKAEHVKPKTIKVAVK